MHNVDQRNFSMDWLKSPYMVQLSLSSILELDGNSNSFIFLYVNVWEQDWEILECIYDNYI